MIGHQQQRVGPPSCICSDFASTPDAPSTTSTSADSRLVCRRPSRRLQGTPATDRTVEGSVWLENSPARTATWTATTPSTAPATAATWACFIIGRPCGLRIIQIPGRRQLERSGNYGLFGFGAYNGQGGSLREQNDELHLISRFTLPYTFDNGQICETGIQGYTGRYVVLGSNINPLGVGPAVTPANTRNTGGEEGVLDQRLGGTFIWYPQPLGFQTEWTVGRGPALDETQTRVEQRSLYGGYLMMNAKLDARQYGIVFPFARWQYYQGGYKSARNAPYSLIDEWNIGVEWQIRKEIEFVVEYCITDRTNLSAQSSGESYRQFVGDVLRFQFQANY